MNNFIHHLKTLDQSKAYALDAETYSDPDFLKLENKTVFESQWQLVGHVNQLANTGDQMICQIGRIPLIILRNQENQLKAFHNVCRHRAGPLVLKNGNSKILRCKYHGWGYDLDGALKTAPEMQSTPNFEICQHRLPEAYLNVWQGFIFVAIKQPETSVDELLAGIVEQIKPIDLSKMSFSHRDEYIIECNWKVYMDNYLEGYHLPHVHPSLSKLLDYRSYDTQLAKWYSYQFSPLDNAENNDAAIFYGEGNAHYYCIFPNLMLNILPGRLQTNLILPIGQRKTRILFDYYYSDIHSAKTQKLIKQDREFSDEVQQEDITICEQVQTGLDSGSYQTGPLCMKRESGVLHFQNLIRKIISENMDSKPDKIKKGSNTCLPKP
jgi:choline monooxygenase